jgi:hypothetical protein
MSRSNCLESWDNTPCLVIPEVDSAALLGCGGDSRLDSCEESARIGPEISVPEMVAKRVREERFGDAGGGVFGFISRTERDRMGGNVMLFGDRKSWSVPDDGARYGDVVRGEGVGLCTGLSATSSERERLGGLSESDRSGRIFGTLELIYCVGNICCKLSCLCVGPASRMSVSDTKIKPNKGIYTNLPLCDWPKPPHLIAQSAGDARLTP